MSARLPSAVACVHVCVPDCRWRPGPQVACSKPERGSSTHHSSATVLHAAKSRYYGRLQAGGISREGERREVREENGRFACRRLLRARALLVAPHAPCRPLPASSRRRAELPADRAGWVIAHARRGERVRESRQTSCCMCPPFLALDCTRIFSKKNDCTRMDRCFFSFISMGGCHLRWIYIREEIAFDLCT